MPVIGGQNPTATVTVPIPTPAPMKKPRKPAQPAAVQPVPVNPDSQQQDVPQGMVPPVPQQPEPRAIILPWAPPPTGTPRSAMKKMRVRKYARGDEIAAMVRSIHENPTDALPRNALADYLSENHEAHYTPKEIQALRTTPHLQIEHIPANSSRPVHIAKLTMADIRAANMNAGHHWFDRGNARFFGTKIHGSVKHGPGGVYFVTSERSSHFGTQPPLFSVRRFNPETGDVRTVGVFGGHRTLESASSEALGRAQNHPQFQDNPERMSRPNRYSADDGFDFGMDAMYPEGDEPLQRPAPKEDITGRTRKQILQQMLEAAKKGHFDPAGMTPRDYIADIEGKNDVPQGGGDVFMSDPEDELPPDQPNKMSRRIEYPRHMARATPETIEILFNAVSKEPHNHDYRNALADELEQINHPASVVETLRSGLPAWIGKSPKGVINAIPFASKQAMTATDPWGRPKYHSMFHVTSRNRKGQAHGVRVSGKMQTWKTRPDEFRIPWKFGLYDSGELNHRNFREWLLDDPTQEPT